MYSHRTRLIRAFIAALIVASALPAIVQAGAIPLANLPDFTLSSDYLLIARDRINGNTDIAANNFELGANKAPVPSTDSFLDGGSSGGPTLLGAVPDLPANAQAVSQGIGGHGNIAVTDSLGEFGFSDVGVYADPNIGVRVAAPNDSFNKSGNAFFNDPNMYPNTFDTNTQTGVTVGPLDADQSTRMDKVANGGFNTGITYGYDHTSLKDELADARTILNGLPQTATLDVNSGTAGELDLLSTASGRVSLTVVGGNSIGGVDATITLDGPGLHVIDINTITSPGNDFLVNNANFVIDGPANSAVVFRLLGNDNMLMENSNVLAGDGGIGLDSILFYSDSAVSGTHFSGNNTILNGVALWSLGEVNGKISMNNSQGCTQLVADRITLNDVRYGRCAFAIPEPSTLTLLCFGGAGLFARRSRRRRA